MIPQCSLIAFPVGGKKKVTTTTLYFFPKSFTAIKEKKNKKTFCCLYATLWGRFKKPCLLFFCLQFKRANNCSCILLLQLFAVAACVTSMF